LQEDIAKKQFKIKYDTLVRALHTEGYEQTFLKAISYMLFYYVYQYHPSLDKVHNDLVNKFKNPQRLLGFWLEIMEGKHKELDEVKPEEFLDAIQELIGDKQVSIDDFYYQILAKRNMPTGRIVKVQNQMQEVFFLALLHVLILASDDRALDDAISYKLLQ
jgi:hypothetical protein